MIDLIAGFGNQLRHALEIGAKANLQANSKEIKNVMITGLGGFGQSRQRRAVATELRDLLADVAVGEVDDPHALKVAPAHARRHGCSERRELAQQRCCGL